MEAREIIIKEIERKKEELDRCECPNILRGKQSVSERVQGCAKVGANLEYINDWGTPRSRATYHAVKGKSHPRS